MNPLKSAEKMPMSGHASDREQQNMHIQKRSSGLRSELMASLFSFVYRLSRGPSVRGKTAAYLLEVSSLSPGTSSSLLCLHWPSLLFLVQDLVSGNHICVQEKESKSYIPSHGVISIETTHFHAEKQRYKCKVMLCTLHRPTQITKALLTKQGFP